MSTEGTSRRFAELDMWPTEDAVRAMFESQLAAAAAVQPEVEPLARAAEAAAGRLGHPDGRLVYAGAGTSGRLAILDGTELEPTFGWSRERLIYAIAGGMGALSGSVENAEDDEESARKLVRSAKLGRNDVVIGVSASGTTPFTLAAIREAGGRGALTIALASNSGSPLLLAAEHPIFLDTGAEVVAGSTRMKAGTAQKIALNLLSTAIMLRLGRVHGGLMVGMRISNRKLRNRAIAVVAEISGAELSQAEAALCLAKDDIKLAVLVGMGATLEQGRGLLIQSRDNLRAAMAAARGGR
ncbi:MAG TPA: N-acetylmuramic acid 6-phosphate etherase [Sphingomicrobium sp.]|nr:N-acetylmuramic acid 6-phosphate etherase [Sphingomicrobium sp.]